MEKSRLEKGGFPIEGINLALCENPLPPIDEATEAAKAETYLSNHYTDSKAFSLAGFRVGYAISNKELIDYLNNHNDAYPLARTAEAAAIASLEHIEKIKERIATLKRLARDFTESLQGLGIKTYPTKTYFFLGKVPISADEFARKLSESNIHIRSFHHERLENRFLRFATSTPENNRIVLDAIRDILKIS